ncbi:24263_t:CDS:2, partial [Gigaspora margarita]
LEEHLALDCSTQNKDVIDFYTQIIANRQGHGQAVSQKNIPKSTKLTPQHKCNINSALIKAFIVCNISFYIISNSYFVDALREFWPEYQPPSRQLLAN